MLVVTSYVFIILSQVFLFLHTKNKNKTKTEVTFLVKSGAARAPVTGLKLAMEGPPDRVGPLPQMETSRFSPTLLSRGPSRAQDGPLEA